MQSSDVLSMSDHRGLIHVIPADCYKEIVEALGKQCITLTHYSQWLTMQASYTPLLAVILDINGDILSIFQKTNFQFNGNFNLIKTTCKAQHFFPILPKSRIIP